MRYHISIFYSPWPMHDYLFYYCYSSEFKYTLSNAFRNKLNLGFNKWNEFFILFSPVAIPLHVCVEKSMLTIRLFMWWCSCLRWRRSTFSMMRLMFFIISHYMKRWRTVSCMRNVHSTYMLPSINFLFHQFISSSCGWCDGFFFSQHYFFLHKFII